MFNKLKQQRSIISALDPLIFSGTVFLIQAAVLLTASKIEFAVFSLSYSYVLMGQALSAAVVGGPMLTLLGRLSGPVEQEAVGLAILKLQLLLSLLMGAVGMLIAWLLGAAVGITVLIALGIVGLSYRDGLRNVLLAQLKLNSALGVAIAFAFCTLAILVGMFFLFDTITAVRALGALSIGVVCSNAGYLLKTVSQSGKPPRDSVAELRRMAMWTLPGTTVIWLQNSFYLTLLAISLNLDAVAEVSAARLLVMPVLIAGAGILRLVQVDAAKLLKNGSIKIAVRKAHYTVSAILAIGLIAALLCVLVDRMVDPSILPSDFPNLIKLTAVWVLFTAAILARGVFSALLQAMGRYRELFIFTLIILPFVLGGIAFAPAKIGLIGAVLPMAAGELALLGLLVWRARSSPST